MSNGLTRAQLLMGDKSEGTVLPGKVQGVKDGPGVSIADDGTISFDSSTASGVVKTNNPSAYNSYVWPTTSPPTVGFLSVNNGNLVWVSTSTGTLGTVTSVNVSGGTTGLTFSGGPVITTGTLTAAGTLVIANGGTGATDAATARTNLGAGTVNSVTAGAGLAVDAAVSGGTITNTGTLNLTETGVVPGSYTNTNLVVDEYGRISAAVSGSSGGSLASGVSMFAIDDISALFDGTTSVFTVESGGNPLPSYLDDVNLLLEVGGVIQPWDEYSFNSTTSEVTFSSPPSAGLSFNGRYTISNDPGIPSGTKMLFYEASAPLGWTQVLTQNNKALRVVSGTGGGSGGTSPFTTAFAVRTGSVDAHALTVAQMPSHGHNQTDNTWGLLNQNAVTPVANHVHPYTYSTVVSDGGGPGGLLESGGEYMNSVTIQNTFGQGAHTHYIYYSGGSEAHPHTYTLDFAVQYIDIIICSKN